MIRALCVAALLPFAVVGADLKSVPALPSPGTLISHRGESLDAPENTFPAFKLAVDRGFGFECDVYLSKDGRVFTFHDRNLTRTTGGAVTNQCKDVDWDGVLSGLDVGSWGRWAFSRYAGTKPSLLEDVLDLAVDGRMIYIEIKTGPEIVPYVKKTIESQTKADPGNVLFISFNDKTCKALKEQMPKYKVYLLSSCFKGSRKNRRGVTAEEMIKKLDFCKADGLDCSFHPEFVTAEFIQKIKAAGYEFHAWTIDSLQLALEAFKRGAMTVTTNCAKRLLDEYLLLAGQKIPRAPDRTYDIPDGHLEYVEYRLMDRTDRHNELVFKKTILAGRNEESFEVRAPVFAIEDLLTREGTAYVRLGPLPQARPGSAGPDATVDFRARRLVIHDNGYECMIIPYKGGAAGRTKALQDTLRSLRPYKPQRDALFTSNTWGDFSGRKNICEKFLKDEIDAACDLGVEMLQVDDGWQIGRPDKVRELGYWAANPSYWDFEKTRFPNGFKPVADYAKKKGIKLGLWYCPDFINDNSNWERDAARLLQLYRSYGLSSVKLDSIKTASELSLLRQGALFDALARGSKDSLVVDLDITADKRPGYYGLKDAGSLFIENRYTDTHTYWPHLTLRSLWSLSEVTDPLRLRIEVLNPERNKERYAGDPLAPSCYPPDAIFAVALVASPLGWFEIQNLSEETKKAWRPLVSKWKGERDAMAACNVLGVGAKPDGLSWTGFVLTPRAAGGVGYAVFYRGLKAPERYDFDFAEYFPPSSDIEVLSPRGKADMKGVSVSSPLDYVWVKVKPRK